MAKSIYETLQTLETETSVPEIKDKDGKVIRPNFGMVKHTLPAEKLPTPEEFEDEEKLLEWAKQSGQLHQCLQSGVQARIIDYRAIFKAPPKKADIDKGIEWSPEYGQANVDNAEWPITKRPGTGTNKKVDQARFNDCMLAVANSKKAKMSDADILKIFEPVYGADMINTCLKAIAEAKQN